MTSHAKDGWTEGDPPSAPADEPVSDAEPGTAPTGDDANADPPVDGPGAETDGAAGDEGVDDEALVDTAAAPEAGWGNLPPPPPGFNDNLADYEAELFSDEAVGLAGLAAERDEYRDALMRVKADFDNYRKRVAKEQASTVERAAEKLVTDLLPVLDACEAALGHGSEDVEPIFKSLADILEKSGLQRMEPEGQPFDPNLHEAVLHEPGESDETIVVESLRSGYLWNGRVVRPAMVKVKG
jgi:molecular chaperone GrpE